MHDETLYSSRSANRRGLGFTQTKNGLEYIRWERVTKYLAEFGIPTSGDGSLPSYIPENVFYRLGKIVHCPHSVKRRVGVPRETRYTTCRQKIIRKGSAFHRIPVQVISRQWVDQPPEPAGRGGVTGGKDMDDLKSLIPVSYDNPERPTVSGRELHDFLEVDSNYTTWFKRMCEYGVTAHVDYESCFPNLESENQHGGQNKVDHQLTIPMAKELCMIQRNERGKQARQYFLAVEAQWNSPEGRRVSRHP